MSVSSGKSKNLPCNDTRSAAQTGVKGFSFCMKREAQFLSLEC